MAASTNMLHRRQQRVVAQLTFPEILVVWTLRQYFHADADISRVVPQFLRAFGLARLRRAIDTFCALTNALTKSSANTDAQAKRPSFVLGIGPVDDPNLSVCEEEVLAVLTAFQCGDDKRAGRIIDWNAAGDGKQSYRTSAAAFAILMREAGHPLPGAPTLAPLPTYAAHAQRHQVTATVTASVTAAVDAVADLTRGEALMISAIRTWVLNYKENGDPHAALAEGFATINLSAGTASLDAILRNIGLTAIRSVDIRCPRCPGISQDEARMLHAVASAQQDEIMPAFEILSHWMPPSPVRLTLDAVHGLALAFRNGGHLLPVRDWQFAIVPDRAPVRQNVHAITPRATLH